VVTINYQDFILPFAQGVKLVELMQTAVGCGRDFESSGPHPRYIVGEQPAVELCSLKASQVVTPLDVPRLTHR
jgi:hypothetical protein